MHMMHSRRGGVRLYLRVPSHSLYSCMSWAIIGPHPAPERRGPPMRFEAVSQWDGERACGTLGRGTAERNARYTYSHKQ